MTMISETTTAIPMKTEILERLICPECAGKLTLSVARQMESAVAEGWLTCSCGRSFPIVGTVPRMLRDWEEFFPSLGRSKERQVAAMTRYEFLKRWTQRQFGFQWTTFWELSCDFWHNFFTSLGPIDPDFFKGKRGLDAGCGFGRHLIQAVRCGARMVGVDYSRAIESSLQNTRAFPEIALVQADLEHLPFPPDSFDFVYSIGVLHHLPDPFRGFSALTRHVKPGGAVIVWCYSSKRRWTIRILELIRWFTKRLPLVVLRWISVATAMAEWYLLVIPYRLLPKTAIKSFFARLWPRLQVYEPYPLQVFCADWFDRLAAPVRHYYSAGDLEKWCANLGLVNVRVTPTGLYGWTLYAERSSQATRSAGPRPVRTAMKRPVQVLVFSPIPKEGAGARFRIYQYLPALEADGFEVTVRPFFTPELFQIVYQSGANMRKMSLLMRQAWARWQLLLRRAHYDLFFVYREAFPIGPPMIEWLLAQTKGRALIYDFDDAVFLQNQTGTRLRGFLKHPQKVSQILRVSSQVVTGNEYLADYARRYNERVDVIPTCIDTTKFMPAARPDSDRPTVPMVGWIGSHTTAKYLQNLLPVLTRVAETHPFRLYVVGSAAPIGTPGLEVIQVPWALSREVEDFQRCDVGVYPLWDDDWCRGKCGFKAIQFMACGVPVVASSVGVNKEIIRDGENGFLAATEDEWVEKLRRLLADLDLRKRMGQAGRQTIEQRYSLAVHEGTVVDTFKRTLEHVRGNGA